MEGLNQRPYIQPRWVEANQATRGVTLFHICHKYLWYLNYNKIAQKTTENISTGFYTRRIQSLHLSREFS